MITYAEAQKIIESLVFKTPLTVSCPLGEALGRVLASDIRAPFSLPSFTNSAMDGYGVAFDQAKSPATLAVDQKVWAGQLPRDLPDQPGSCIQVMTGAPLPPWVDTVIPVEQVESLGPREIKVLSMPPKGSHIRHQGEDLPIGSALLKAGSLMTPERIMVAAAFGLRQLPVVDEPQVHLWSTGDEIVEPGSNLAPGQVYNSSRFFLETSLKKLGVARPTWMYLVDEPQIIAAHLRHLCESGKPTILISTGAVSQGEADFLPKVAQEQGWTILFHKVAIRPGKPVLLAQKDQVIWLGLPGNPVSTAVGWHFFGHPLFSKLMGVPPAPSVRLTLKNDVQKPSGLRCFYRAEVREPFAWVASKQGSGHLAASLSSNAYVILPEGLTKVVAGTKVEAVVI